MHIENMYEGNAVDKDEVNTVVPKRQFPGKKQEIQILKENREKIYNPIILESLWKE